METFRKDLSERYFSIWEYFKVSFKFFKDVIKESKIRMGFAILFSLIGIILSIINIEYVVLSMICYSFVLILLISLQKKVLYRIEENNKKVSLIWIIWRRIVLDFAFTVLGIAMSPFLFLFHFLIGIGLKNKVVFTSLFILSNIIFFAFCLIFLYFFQIFFMRNYGVIKSFEKNLYLSKGNRLKLAIPIVLIYGVWKGITYAINYGYEKFLISIDKYSILSIITIIIIVLITLFTVMYAEILSLIVYLNVEYRNKEKIN